MPRRPVSSSTPADDHGRRQATVNDPRPPRKPLSRAEVWKRRGPYVVLFTIAAVALLYAGQVLVGALNARDAKAAADPRSSPADAGGPSGAIASAAPTVSPTPGPTAAPKTVVKPAGPCGAGGTNVLDGHDPFGGCWPGPSNTGVPAGVKLTAYTGSCSITTPNTVLRAMLITCDSLDINAPGVVVDKSQINGTISNSSSSASFTISDSWVNASPNGIEQVTGVGDENYTMVRTEVTGGNRGVYCSMTCTIRDSWVHGQKIKDDWHASAVRMEQQTTIVHNSLVCDAPVQPNPEGSCSATLTGYGDFAPIRNNVIKQNLFLTTTYAAFCAYGGATKGKPYSGQTANITFADNTFQRGNRGFDCALYGPISDWDPSLPGMVWTNNKFDDGEVIQNKAY